MELLVRVRGVVQGVGFRPFVWRLAHELGLDGQVGNDEAGVAIRVRGDEGALRGFLDRLRRDAPPRARVDAVESEAAPSGSAALGAGFHIVESRAAQGALSTAIGPDIATCDDCLRELFSPGDRRHRYAFINCTQCGPRFTITRHLPYDRAQTSMARFPLCAACRREYQDPADRRFHAEPNACPACGPRLSLCDADGRLLDEGGGDPIAAVLSRLRAGQVVAIKGLGGYHLACDARNAEAVAALRGRKLREAKPLAVLLGGAEAARRFVTLDAAEEALLSSPERPIVLARKRPGVDEELPGVAPGMAWLGVMLPCTPIQHLLFHEAAGRPGGAASTAWMQGTAEAPSDLALVMTSANPGGEPLVIGDDEALARLGGIADAFLRHDRQILLRCDDSVARIEDAHVVFVRRARGFAPRAIALPRSGPPVLALGASLKNTVCVTRGDEAFLSPHVGDLDNGPTCEALAEAAEHLCRILEVRPEIVAHDRHPDFFSTRHAAELAGERGLVQLAVQHHHAHIAALCAEHGVEGPVLGLALDGVGLGDRDEAWGGELLFVDGARFERLGHLATLLLPGGDRAAREPWRMAASALRALGRGDEIAARFPSQRAAARLDEVMARGLNCPPTSSAGRLFDAAAGLLGLREEALFEGQAAMELEGLAVLHGALAPHDVRGDDFRLSPGGEVLDLLPLLARLADLRDPDGPMRGAALFHATLAAALAAWVEGAATRTGLRTVALGGGCFLNRLLGVNLAQRLTRSGLRVLTARAAPPNDGGIALGQAWVALQSAA